MKDFFFKDNKISTGIFIYKTDINEKSSEQCSELSVLKAGVKPPQ